MLVYIPNENKSPVLSNEIKLSNALQDIMGGGERGWKTMRNIFPTEEAGKHLL